MGVMWTDFFVPVRTLADLFWMSCRQLIDLTETGEKCTAIIIRENISALTSFFGIVLCEGWLQSDCIFEVKKGNLADVVNMGLE